MSKLILSLGGKKIKEYALNKAQTIIGRSASNDIQIENLAISNEHAKIITILSDSFLEDLKSTNGTYVNGTLVNKKALQHGDEITIGKHKLQYINENSDTSEFNQAVVIQHAVTTPSATSDFSNQTSQNISDLSGHPTVNNKINKLTTKHIASLAISNGNKAGQILHLTKSLTTLGQPETQVAAIAFKQGKYFLIHIETIGKRKMPMLNGKEIDQGYIPLAHKDKITIADTKMVLTLG